jgi:hypothetical protein
MHAIHYTAGLDIDEAIRRLIEQENSKPPA